VSQYWNWRSGTDSLDAGEITDKGCVNQRKVLARRAALVDMLYTDPVPDGVTVAGRMA
jgi:feruloyl-CoA synthase